MELKQLTDQIYCITGAVNLGLLKQGKKVILIDTGLDSSTAKKVLSHLDENDFSLQAIINTHSHADHCGGNAYLKKETGTKIYASEIEAAIVQYSYLEPLYLFSGASPIGELKNKFLMAEPSRVNKVIKFAEKSLEINRIDLEIIPLPGHSPNQIGIEKDGVLFCADAVFSPEIIKKHRIPFYNNIERQKETLKWLKRTNYDLYIPSHGEPVTDIKETVEANLRIIKEIEEYLLKSLDCPKSTEEILKEMCDQYELKIDNPQKYYLMNTVAMAYLSSLSNQGKIKSKVSKNQLFWQKKSD